jgi:hypothetical protein
MTCSYNDLNFGDEEEEEKSPSCTRREFPGKIEDCIDNARDLFEEYFNSSILEILGILRETNNINNEKLILEVNNSPNKYNFINSILYFIKFNNDKELENEIINFGLQVFYKLFTYDIQIIYKLHLFNDTEESKTFWNYKK